MARTAGRSRPSCASASAPHRARRRRGRRAAARGPRAGRGPRRRLRLRALHLPAAGDRAGGARRAAGRVTRRKLLHSRAFQRSNEHATSSHLTARGRGRRDLRASTRPCPWSAAPRASTPAASRSALQYYGHGYGVAVGPGQGRGRPATNWYDDGYGWTGVGAPGDSGSAVVTANGFQAAGDFTHLIVDTGAYPGTTSPARGSRRSSPARVCAWSTPTARPRAPLPRTADKAPPASAGRRGPARRPAEGSAGEADVMLDVDVVVPAAKITRPPPRRAARRRRAARAQRCGAGVEALVDLGGHDHGLVAARLGRRAGVRGGRAQRGGGQRDGGERVRREVGTVASSGGVNRTPEASPAGQEPVKPRLITGPLPE